MAWLDAQEQPGLAMIRPIGWLQTNPATGPVLTEEVRAAFEDRENKADEAGSDSHFRRPPMCSALFASVDVVGPSDQRPPRDPPHSQP